MSLATSRLPNARRPLALAGLSILYAAFFTQGLPFYFEDLQWVGKHDELPTILLRVLNPFQHGAFARPFEDLCLQGIRRLCGYEPWCFHALKSVAFGCLVALVYSLVRRFVSRDAWAVVGAALFMVLMPVLESVSWICDFEVVAQGFAVAALLVFEMDFESSARGERSRRSFQAAVVSLALLACAAKGSARVLPLVLAGRVLAARSGLFKRYAAMLAVLLLIALAPEWAGASRPAAGSVLPKVLSLAGKLATVVGWPLIILGIGATLFTWVSDRATRPVGEKRPGQRLTLALLWCLANLLILPFLPASDSRYLVGTLAAVIMLGTVALCSALELLRLDQARGRAVICVLVLLVAGQAAYNFYLAVQFRAFWGSQFIAASKVVGLVEARYRDAVVIYPYWRPFLYAPEAHNSYVLMRADELAGAGVTLVTTDQGTALSFEQRPPAALLASMIPDPSLELVATIEGRTGSRFDALATALHLRPRAMMESPYLEQPTDYPTLYYLYDVTPIAR